MQKKGEGLFDICTAMATLSLVFPLTYSPASDFPVRQQQAKIAAEKCVYMCMNAVCKKEEGSWPLQDKEKKSISAVNHKKRQPDREERVEHENDKDFSGKKRGKNRLHHRPREGERESDIFRWEKN